MRIPLLRDRNSGRRTSTARATLLETGYTFVEVMAASAILGFVAASVYWGLTAGNRLIQSTQNLRATQVMLQKMEAIRLFTWSQVGDTNNYLTSNFIEDYDPSGLTNSTGGAKYRCYVSAGTPAVGELPEAYRTNMRTITVTLYWTNNTGAGAVVHKREMQTRVARNGMQNYIWGAL